MIGFSTIKSIAADMLVPMVAVPEAPGCPVEWTDGGRSSDDEEHRAKLTWAVGTPCVC